MNKWLLRIITLLFLSSYVFIHTDDSIELGKRYYFLPDGDKSSILLDIAEKGDPVSGIEVIKANVLDYRFDKDFIIVKSQDGEAEDANFMYWIIDKTISIDITGCKDQESCDSIVHSNVIGPIDSIRFYQELKGRRIVLNFRY